MHDDSDPIRHLVVLGHPKAGSFNHSVAQAYCDTVCASGQQADLRDLYAIGFDPCLRADERPGTATVGTDTAVEAEFDLVRAASVVTLVYPIWFGTPPAIIKGYVDRVFGADFEPRGLREGAAQPALRNKRLVQFSTSASTMPWLEEQGQWISLRQAFGAYLATVFGMRGHEHVHFDAVVEGLPPRAADEYLAQVGEKARGLCAALLSDRHAARLHPARG